ncbi:UNVERIFIED_CONTAM: hypothetical protein FKN15_037060 [Acipenser sinensis]
MASAPTVCVSADSFATSVSGEDQTGQGHGPTSSTSLAQESLVCLTDTAPVRTALAVAQSPRPAQPGTGCSVASRPIEPTALGLAPERLHLSRLGLSNRVIDTLQNARAASTRSQYGYKWGVFQTWCLSKGEDPTMCPMAVILQFLQDLLDEGKSPSTLKVYLAAISACHVKIDSVSPGAHFLAGQFLKGARRLRPPRKDVVPHWRLNVVLNALTKPPFEPMHSAELKLLSFKTAFLVAVTSAKRVSELQALSVAKACLYFAKDRSRVTLRTNPAFLPKTISAFHVNQSVELEAFHPPPFQSDRDRMLHTLCPVRALAYYVERTRSWRQSEQLFVCYGSQSQGQALSKQRLSRWLTETVKFAYQLAKLPPPEKITGHSTRGQATSWAMFQGASVMDICNAAVWATPHTFTRFYRMNIVDPLCPGFGSRVLRAASVVVPSTTG